VTSRKNWAGWYVAGKDLVLDLPGRKEAYWIPLAEAGQAPHGWTWLHQVASKTWGTPVVVDGLVRALEANGVKLDPVWREEAMTLAMGNRDRQQPTRTT
jgi:hypothetical protein